MENSDRILIDKISDRFNLITYQILFEEKLSVQCTTEMFLFFAHNMYNPRPRKYNELPANDLSTKEDTTDMKPL